MGTTVEVRIGDDAKKTVQEYAKGKGITVSAAVRRLLELWVAGVVDLDAIDKLPSLPSSDELEKLANTLEWFGGILAIQASELEDTTHDVNDAVKMVRSFLQEYSTVLGGEHRDMLDGDLQALLALSK